MVQVIRAGEARAFWRIMQACLANERERAVIYLSYTRGLAPRDIRTRFGDQFPTVAEVYRIKHNALNWLRQSAALSAPR